MENWNRSLAWKSKLLGETFEEGKLDGENRSLTIWFGVGKLLGSLLPPFLGLWNGLYRKGSHTDDLEQVWNSNNTKEDCKNIYSLNMKIFHPALHPQAGDLGYKELKSACDTTCLILPLVYFLVPWRDRQQHLDLTNLKALCGRISLRAGPLGCQVIWTGRKDPFPFSLPAPCLLVPNPKLLSQNRGFSPMPVSPPGCRQLNWAGRSLIGRVRFSREGRVR